MLSELTLIDDKSQRGPKHYIFGDQFYVKNARKLRFHVLLHFLARKHDIIILPGVDHIHKKL